MYRQTIRLIAILSAGAVLASSCASVKISPRKQEDDFVDRAHALRQDLDTCSESTSYLCTDRAVCGAQFPRVEEPVELRFGRVAGFQKFTAVVEPEGYVSEIHRFKKGKYAADKMSITACTANLALGSL